MPDTHAEWQQLLKNGMRHVQQRILEEEAEVKTFRVFQTVVVPGLAQIPDYARACLSHSEPLFGPRHDVDETVRIRMQRQEVLRQPDRRFHFIIAESALRFRLCERQVMVGQLDHLLSVEALPSVKLGVIGFNARYGAAFPKHGFALLDDDHVNVETFSAELTITQQSEVELYGKELRLACWHRQLRRRRPPDHPAGRRRPFRRSRGRSSDRVDHEKFRETGWPQTAGSRTTTSWTGRRPTQRRPSCRHTRR